MMNNTKPSFFEYALLTFLILWSGGGFTYGLFPEWMTIGVILVSFLFFHRGYKLQTKHIISILVLTGILLLQMIKFGGAIISTIRPLCVIIISCMTSLLIGQKFTRIFFNIIYSFALISLVFWLIDATPTGHSALYSIANSLPQLGWNNLIDLENGALYENTRTIYFYTCNAMDESLPRNSGPFWEPGRFVIFLIIAYAVNLFYYKEKLFCKSNVILLLAIITTFSTTGYTALAIILSTYVLAGDIKTSKKVFLWGILTIIALYVWQLDFMAEKIATQSLDIDTEWSRFGAIYYHWTQIVESPFVGYGPYIIISGFDTVTSPNGLTDLLRYYGIPGALFLYVLLFKGTGLYISNNLIYRVGSFIAILVLCFSQTITYSPFFYLLYFFGLNNSQYETVK